MNILQSSIRHPSSSTALPGTASLLGTIGTTKAFARKDLIIREGGQGNSLFVLLKGRIRIFTEDLDGHRFVIGTYDAGVLFGEGALDGGPRTASVEAVTDCECIVVTYKDLFSNILERPDFSLALITELIKRSRASTQKLKSLALESVYLRLRQLITSEAQEIDGKIVLGPDMSQQEIANRLGSSRDMVTRILRELGKGGYILAKRGEIVVLKPLPKAW